MNITSKGMQNARLRAGHTQVQTSVEVECSPNIINNLEVRDAIPKSVHLQKALATYIKKYARKK